MTRMLTKARELSGAEDRHNGRKEARKIGSRFSLKKYASLAPLRAAIAAIPHRYVNKQFTVLPRPGMRWYSPAERVDGRGFRPQFLSDTPGFHSDNMAARWRSRQERCMTGRDERERAVHCANREGREGHTGPVSLLCVCSLICIVGCVFNGVCFDFIRIIC